MYRRFWCLPKELDRAVSFLVICGMLIMGGMMVRNYIEADQEPPSTMGELRTNSRKMHIRLAPEPGFLQEDILITEHDSSDGHWFAIRGPSDPGLTGIDYTDYTESELPPDMQQRLVTLQDAWCDTPPIFPPPAESEFAHELSIRCAPSGRIEQFFIPASQLPPIFTDLITITPSPKIKSK